MVLGLLLSGNGYAEENKNEQVYLECKTPGGPYTGYGIYHKLSHVMVPDRDTVDMVPLKITAGRYDFEYFPLKNIPIKHIISINRFTGEMILILETELEGKKEIDTFKGMCFKRDLDKTKF